MISSEVCGAARHRPELGPNHSVGSDHSSPSPPTGRSAPKPNACALLALSRYACHVWTEFALCGARGGSPTPAPSTRNPATTTW